MPSPNRFRRHPDTPHDRVVPAPAAGPHPRRPNVNHSFDYARLRRDIHWDSGRKVLGLTEDGQVNIGVLCTDRIVQQGKADKLALIHEDHAGAQRRFTFLDMMQLSNGWADFLSHAGVRRLDRVCLLLDRCPELYIAFLGIVKTGAVVQPLFSAFGEDAFLQRAGDSAAVAVITQHKHLSKIRKVREKLPALKTVVVVDHGPGARPLREADGEVPYEMMEHRVAAFPAAATYAESPSVLHYTRGTTGMPKGALHVHGASWRRR